MGKKSRNRKKNDDKNKCAKCGIRTDFPVKKKRNRRPPLDWMRRTFARAVPIDLKDNRFICRKCYDDLKRFFISTIDEALEPIDNLFQFDGNTKANCQRKKCSQY